MEEYGEQLDEEGYPLKNDEDSPGEAILQSMADREEQYTELTRNFVKINYNRYKYKEFHKWVFFWTMTIILLFIAVIFGIVAIKVSLAPSDQIIKHIPVLLGSYASFISAIVAIPLLIGKYLFNKSEEADLGKIVENMQSYDKAGHAQFMHFFYRDYRNH